MSYSDAYDPREGIAIVGMAGRFPGARTPRELWRNLLLGRETISCFQPEELEPAGADEMAQRLDPAYVRARGIIEDVDKFDAAFFGITPKEAEVLDPQQRLFLEAAWEALEDAGYDPKSFSGPIGVFAGSSNNCYFLNNLLGRKDVTETVGWLITMMGNEKDYLATRVAYKLDLKGPALNIVTACSTSLVTVCSAVQSLANYQCDMALAGGVSVTLPQRRGYLAQEGAITSPDGHCRAFDQRAAGTVFSNGLGIVVLRRLADAVAAGDTVYAVIKGAALNNDGNAKVSFTAPSVEGHAQVIATAQALAGIDPDTISYVEAHGTGTSLGDPIEIAGLTRAFRVGGAIRNRTCALGALKTNIGHLDAAAGVAGLIKTALALHHRTLPATLHFKAPTPKLDLDNTPFFVNAQCRPWDAGGQPLRAGVSSFGVGGTNAHVVLEEAPVAELPEPGRRIQLMVFSARTPAALDEQCQRLSARISEQPELDIADAAYTLQTGRRAFEHRFAFTCKDRDGALAILSNRRGQKMAPRCADGFAGVAFLFPGQGAQHVGMGRELYDSEPLFRREVDESCELLTPLLCCDLRQILYPAPERMESANTEVTQTSVTQPALFVIEYALARLWMSWGVHPTAMIGHSLGEYVAATIGGTFDRDDAIVLLARRAALMQAQPSGRMLAVKAPAERLDGLLTGDLSVAAYNSPGLVVVSGGHGAIDALQKELAGHAIACRSLPTSHAFHSSMMDPILGAFTELVRAARPRPPRQPWISCLTGILVTEAEACDPAYWARQLRQPVRFSEGVSQLLDRPLALLEIGPGRTLGTLARQHGARKPAQQVVATLPGERSEVGELDSMLQAIGQLWTAGCAINWTAFNKGHRRRRISLPTYPFERTRCWVDPPVEGPQFTVSASVRATTSPALDTQSDGRIMQQRVEVNHATTEGEVIRDSLRQLFSELSGLEPSSLDPETSFFELGLDSLVLTQAAGALNKRFGVKIKFRELLEDCATITALAIRIAQLAPGSKSPPVAAPPGTASSTIAHHNPCTASSAAGSADLVQLLAQSMQQTARQLELMQQCVASISTRTGVGQTQAPPAPPAAPANAGRPPLPAPAAAAPTVPSTSPTQSFGPYRPPVKNAGGALSAEQQRHLDSFIERYSRRTRKSKELTALYRSHLADPRSVAGFRLSWKELVYPIVTERSEGSSLWDIDGNRYVDLVNGFGSIFFGHNPEFVRSALKAQLDAGIEIGPQSPIAGKVAALVCETVGMQRAAFCNTGSEAVTASIRMARTVTGRDKIVMFAGAYHGIFDEVLVRPRVRDGQPGAQPIAPGIPAAMAENVMVLEYGDDAALDAVRAHADELAAVLVEPVQSRRPDLQPREFLHELRQITARSGTALVFDEVVTGFRVHPGGMQAVFGVKADIATYGKVLGGGLPIGVVAGDARFLDSLDGGMWRFGDQSVPEVGVTFFAGTFVRHPLALAAASAVLERLRDGGPELQRGLNLRTSEFVARLNAVAREAQAPVRLKHCASWFMIDLPPDAPLSSLFFASMRDHGVHIWEGRPGFLTLMHSDADLDRVCEAFRKTLEEMQRADFLPRVAEQGVAEPVDFDPFAGDAQRRLPLTPQQIEVWVESQMGSEASCAYNQCFVLHLRGPLSASSMANALNVVIGRHAALRTTFNEEATAQQILSSLDAAITVHDLTELPPTERRAALDRIVEEETTQPFDLAKGPLVRARLVRESVDLHRLVLTVHHIVCDGWSSTVLFSDLAAAYAADRFGLLARLPAAMSYETYVEGEVTRTDTADDEAYWLQQFTDGVPILHLPGDRKRPVVRTRTGARQTLGIEAAMYKQLQAVGAKNGATLFHTLLAAFETLVFRLSDQTDLVIGMPIAGQLQLDNSHLVAHCVSTLPLRCRIAPDSRFADFLRQVRTGVLDAQGHANVTFSRLLPSLRVDRDPSSPPLVSIVFNVDKLGAKFDFGDLVVERVETPKRFVTFDLSVNVVDSGAGLVLEFHYNTDLFDAVTIQRWLKHFEVLLAEIVRDPSQTIARIDILGAEERQRLLLAAAGVSIIAPNAGPLAMPSSVSVASKRSRIA